MSKCRRQRTAALCAMHACALVVVALFALGARSNASSSLSSTVSLARARAAHEVAFVEASAVRSERAPSPTPRFVALPDVASVHVDEAVSADLSLVFFAPPVARDVDRFHVSARGPPSVA